MHVVTAPAPDRTMPDTAQPTVERVLDGQEHIVRMELGHWAHEYLLDLFRTLDADHRLRALVVSQLAGEVKEPLRSLRRAHIASQITAAMDAAGRTTHDMTATQADDLAEALTDAAVDPNVCAFDSWHEDCQNLTDGTYCTVHDGSQS